MTTRTKKNKYVYLYVLQGSYNNKWEDLTQSEVLREMKQDKKLYVLNDPRPYRIIKRRVKNI